MKVLIIYFFLCGITGCSVFKPQGKKYYDSVYIKIDTIRVTTANGTFDTVRYYKSHVQSRRDPKWRKINGGIWYLIGTIIIFLIFKTL